MAAENATLMLVLLKARNDDGEDVVGRTLRMTMMMMDCMLKEMRVRVKVKIAIMGKSSTIQENGLTSRVHRKRSSGKGDDFRTGIVPYGSLLFWTYFRRESKPRKKKRRSNANETADADSTYSSGVQTSEDDDMGGENQRYASRVLFGV